MKVSVIIPCKNEALCIAQTVESLCKELEQARVDFEIVMVDDHSDDDTWNLLQALALPKDPSDKSRPPPERIRPIRNPKEPGFGMAVRHGIEHARGDALIIFMADMSDSPADVLRYVQKFHEGYDCIFGSRFMKGSQLIDYPFIKFILNRLGNKMIQIFFGLDFNDVTNAFKGYRREVIQGISPLLSREFNLTVEMPLKAIVQGYSYAVIPISWKNRKRGASKFKISEMKSPYFRTLYSIWLEKRSKPRRCI